MTWLRHSNRHVHATVCDYIASVLYDCGWTTSTPPWDMEDTIEFRDHMPPESELHSIRAGTVVVTIGEEPDSIEQEMGGPLAQQDMPFFVDIFMSKDAYCRAIAQDVKDALHGRLEGTRRVLQVQDHSNDPPTDVDGWILEFTDVEREQIYRLPLYWHSVRFTAEISFSDELWTP